MSLLTICQNIANQTGFNSPTTVVGNADEVVTRMLAQANRAGKELVKEADWVILTTEQTVTTSATAAYAMPSDFKRFLTKTQWDRTNHWELIGPTSPVRWQQLKSGITMSGPRRRYRLKPVSGSVFLFIDPTPTGTGDVSTLVYEYISQNWCQSSLGVGQTAWAADTDTGILSEDMLELGTKWRFLAAMRLPYQEEKAAYERQLGIEKANDGGMPAISANTQTDYPQINLPDINFTL